jgi:hypothetical protein
MGAARPDLCAFLAVFAAQGFGIHLGDPANLSIDGSWANSPLRRTGASGLLLLSSVEPSDTDQPADFGAGGVQKQGSLAMRLRSL